MTTAVDICNLALSRLGDEANISSISPPDDSVQAQYCSRFYPVALRSLLNRHNWGFSTLRAILAQLTGDTSQFEYCYALPNGFLKIIRLLDSSQTELTDYSLEQHSSGVRCLYCNADAVELVYISDSVNPSFFSPLFVEALSVLLANHLAGPILRGDVGVSASAKLLQIFAPALKMAVEDDCLSHKTSDRPTPAAIEARA